MDYGSLGSWGNVLEPHPTHFQPTRNLLPCTNEIQLVKWSTSPLLLLILPTRSACFSLSLPEAFLSHHRHPFSIWCLCFNSSSLLTQTTYSCNALSWKDFNASCRCISRAREHVMVHRCLFLPPSPPPQARLLDDEVCIPWCHVPATSFKTLWLGNTDP